MGRTGMLLDKERTRTKDVYDVNFLPPSLLLLLLLPCPPPTSLSLSIPPLCPLFPHRDLILCHHKSVLFTLLESMGWGWGDTELRSHPKESTRGIGAGTEQLTSGSVL